MIANAFASVVLAATNPVDHVVNQFYRSGDLFGMHGVWLWSAHVGNLVLAGLLTILVLSWAASKIATGPEHQGHERYVTRNRFAHAVEVIINYLRENTVRPMLGDRTDGFMPFLITLFFFILFNNLLGLTPITDTLHIVDHFAGGHYLTGILGATATQNIMVTGALAILAALVFNISGIMEIGIGGYVKHLTAGTPWYLWPLMVPIETIGIIIKPAALMIRLFANMTAGHILVAVLFMFVVSGLGMIQRATFGGVALGGTISLVSGIGAVGIYFLELFVAFLQAFVFMFLTAVFISQFSHHDDHEHHGAHDHEHAHA